MYENGTLKQLVPKNLYMGQQFWFILPTKIVEYELYKITRCSGDYRAPHIFLRRVVTKGDQNPIHFRTTCKFLPQGVYITYRRALFERRRMLNNLLKKGTGPFSENQLKIFIEDINQKIKEIKNESD